MIELFTNISAALLRVRDKETGLWYQVLDPGRDTRTYLEASCSGMFLKRFPKRILAGKV
ncbi:MAG: glycoside hydrolase family 88 protein [Bacteroidales bacterium]|nr:glycoside hydrolase family 88 protein [Bacteroidales bacterium]